MISEAKEGGAKCVKGGRKTYHPHPLVAPMFIREGADSSDVKVPKELIIIFHANTLREAQDQYSYIYKPIIWVKELRTYEYILCNLLTIQGFTHYIKTMKSFYFFIVLTDSMGLHNVHFDA